MTYIAPGLPVRARRQRVLAAIKKLAPPRGRPGLCRSRSGVLLLRNARPARSGPKRTRDRPTSNPSAPFLEADDDGLAGRYGDAVTADRVVAQKLHGGQVRGYRERLVVTASVQGDDAAVVGSSALEGVELASGVRLQQ